VPTVASSQGLLCPTLLLPGTLHLDLLLSSTGSSSSMLGSPTQSGQMLSLPVRFQQGLHEQQQQQQHLVALPGLGGSGSVALGSSMCAENVRVVSTHDLWKNPHNILLMAQAGASCQVWPAHLPGCSTWGGPAQGLCCPAQE